MMHSATRRALADQETAGIFSAETGWMRYRNSRQVTGVVKMSRQPVWR
ncbi:hypothetical protein ACLK19_12160 [Escherichia coli]